MSDVATAFASDIVSRRGALLRRRVSCDMGSAPIFAVCETLPNGKMTFDHHQMISRVSRPADPIGRAEASEPPSRLTRSGYPWRKNSDNPRTPQGLHSRNCNDYREHSTGCIERCATAARTILDNSSGIVFSINLFQGGDHGSLYCGRCANRRRTL